MILALLLEFLKSVFWQCRVARWTNRGCRRPGAVQSYQARRLTGSARRPRPSNPGLWRGSARLNRRDLGQRLGHGIGGSPRVDGSKECGDGLGGDLAALFRKDIAGHGDNTEKLLVLAVLLP